MASTIFQFSHYKQSIRTINRYSSIQIYATYPSIQLLQTNHFVTRQRPKSIASLSNLNRTRNKDSSSSSSTTSTSTSPSSKWEEYTIELFQHYHDPRASQFRIILDYFNIPYDCIEVEPFKKPELGHMYLPEELQHSPLLIMKHREKVKETVDKYKKDCVQFVPNVYQRDCLQIANVLTFKNRVKEYINKDHTKSIEEKDNCKERVDDLFEKYDTFCNDKYNYFLHHDDLFTTFLPMIESNLSNDEHRRFFNDFCESELIEFYCTKYVWTLQACIAKSFHSCFQLFSYVKMFRKMRKWSRFRTEMSHLFGAIKMRLFHTRKYCKKAQTGRQPKGQAMKLTYEFLQTFNEGMPDLNDRGKINKNVEGNEEQNNTKQDIGLIGKPFHGGRNPDILDILVYGALKGVQGLDIHNFLFRKTIEIDEWYTRMQDEVGHSSCKKHI